MPDQFQSLLKAIFDDDRSRVQELLKQSPALVTAGATMPLLATEIAHWIYKGDTAWRLLRSLTPGYYLLPRWGKSVWLRDFAPWRLCVEFNPCPSVFIRG
jgi:hypothetical protein